MCERLQIINVQNLEGKAGAKCLETKMCWVKRKEYETSKGFSPTNTASGHVPVGNGMANPGTLENLASDTYFGKSCLTSYQTHLNVPTCLIKCNFCPVNRMQMLFIVLFLNFNLRLALISKESSCFLDNYFKTRRFKLQMAVQHN